MARGRTKKARRAGRRQLRDWTLKLRFTVTHEDLVGAFGPARVNRADQAEAQRLGFSGDTLEFLCSTGLPAMPKAEIDVPGGECNLRAWDELSKIGWDCPDESKNWIILGNMPATIVTLDAVTGKTFGFYEGFDEYIAMHSDVSSLAYTIYAVKEMLPRVAACTSYEERAEIVDSVQEFISTRDPLPFAHEGGEWNAAFDEIAMGMWT